MNLKNVLTTVGGALLSSTPLGAAAVPLINAFLPGDEKLPENATGIQAQERIEMLPAGAQSELFALQVELQIEQEKGRTARYKAMCAADGQETRAKIVNKAMNALITISILFICFIGYVYMTDGAAAAFNMEMAAVYGVVTGAFAYVVRSYMGDLRTETESRHNAINGNPSLPKGLAGFVQALRK